MDNDELRARGVSSTLRGAITNPLRRLLWPLHAPYFAGVLEEMAELRRGVAQAKPPEANVPAVDDRAGEAAADVRRRYDALKKDLTAIAHRLASLEDQTDAIGRQAEAAPTVTAPAGAESQRASFAQCGEDRIVDYLLRICGGPATIRYLDIGAAVPAGDSNTFLFYQQGGSGVLVEADPGYLPAYRAVRPRDVVESAAMVPAAMKPASGMIELLVTENPGWTSILPERAEQAARLGKGGVRQRLNVPVVTIGEVLERHFATGELHLLSIDAEGIDDAVVRDIDFDRFRPWVLVVETMGAEGPADLLAQRGYASYASTHVNRIFVRQDVLARAVF